MTQQIVQQLKAEGQDFEWYPTTESMITPIVSKLASLYDSSKFSLLDIGAGDGRVLRWIGEKHAEALKDNSGYTRGGTAATYAIEAAPLLRGHLPADVVVVGTDFMRQTLIDKSVDVIFCNPPYSEYELWAERIITECNAPNVFMVIPQRWKEHAGIARAIARRKCAARVIHSDDFTDAERQARAKVDTVWFDMTGMEDMDDEHRRWRSHREGPNEDPFDLWFADHFKSLPDPGPNEENQEKAPTPNDRVGDLVKGQSHIAALAELYRADLDKLIANYQTVCNLDTELLRQLGVSTGGLKSALKEKIKGLKNLYWEELFKRLSALTERLCSTTREKMRRKLTSHVNVDFSEDNALAVVCQALKNANAYLDEQLLEVYDKMTSEENARNYVSNRHMTKDTWRYCCNAKERKARGISHYALEYRLVLHSYGAIDSNSWSFRHSCGLANSAHDYIGDILVVMRNLGFPADSSTFDHHWSSNKQVDFDYTDGEGRTHTLCAIRAFKNGNIHVKFAQEAIRALNVEAARLNGWIKSPKEATQEMGIPEDEAERAFRSNIKITVAGLLGPAA